VPLERSRQRGAVEFVRIKEDILAEFGVNHDEEVLAA
jgi:hypothetical protein